MAETEIQTACSNNGQRDAVEACLSSAVELLRLLEEEKCLLKTFDADRLLQLLPRKDFLVNALFRGLGMLRPQTASSAEAVRFPAEEASGQLRQALRDIERLNGFNRLFIEHSLSHWRRLLTAMDLSGYGPAAEESGAFHLQKGFHFQGEA